MTGKSTVVILTGKNDFQIHPSSCAPTGRSRGSAPICQLYDFFSLVCRYCSPPLHLAHSRRTRVLLVRCDGATSDHSAAVGLVQSPAFPLSQMSFTWRRSMAVFLKRSIMGERGNRFLTINQPVRSVPSRCRFPIRRSFM